MSYAIARYLPTSYLPSDHIPPPLTSTPSLPPYLPPSLPPSPSNTHSLPPSNRLLETEDAKEHARGYPTLLLSTFSLYYIPLFRSLYSCWANTIERYVRYPLSYVCLFVCLFICYFISLFLFVCFIFTNLFISFLPTILFNRYPPLCFPSIIHYSYYVFMTSFIVMNSYVLCHRHENYLELYGGKKGKGKMGKKEVQ